MKNFFIPAMLSVILFASKAQAAGFVDYLSGCMVGLSSSLAGVAVAGSRLNEGEKINTEGYLIAGGIGCIAGFTFSGLASSQASFDAKKDFASENDNLVFQRNRLAKELCLRRGTCQPGGSAIIVETGREIRKQGDKVFESQTVTIEPSR